MDSDATNAIATARDFQPQPEQPEQLEQPEQPEQEQVEAAAAAELGTAPAECGEAWLPKAEGCAADQGRAAAPP